MTDLWFEELKRKILAKRPICEVCNKGMAVQLHHCLVHDMKMYHRELTCEENLMPICEYCHTSLRQVANGITTRMNFAQAQIERGYNIGKWYRELPTKIKEQWLLDMEVFE